MIEIQNAFHLSRSLTPRYLGVAGRGLANDSIASSVGPVGSSENICLSAALSDQSLLESEEAGLEAQPEQDE